MINRAVNTGDQSGETHDPSAAVLPKQQMPDQFKTSLARQETVSTRVPRNFAGTVERVEPFYGDPIGCQLHAVTVTGTVSAGTLKRDGHRSIGG